MCWSRKCDFWLPRVSHDVACEITCEDMTRIVLKVPADVDEGSPEELRAEALLERRVGREASSRLSTTAQKEVRRAQDPDCSPGRTNFYFSGFDKAGANGCGTCAASCRGGDLTALDDQPSATTG